MDTTKTPAAVHPLLEGTTPGEWFMPEMSGPYNVPGTTASGKGDWCYYVNSKEAHEFCPASAHGPSAEEAEANAKLIAAAPTLAAEHAKMRAALEEIIYQAEEGMPITDVSPCIVRASKLLASLTT